MSEGQSAPRRRSRRLLVGAAAAVVILGIAIGVLALGGNGPGPSSAAADMGATEIMGAQPGEPDDPSSTDADLTDGVTEVRVAGSGVQGTALARATVETPQDVELSEGGSVFLTAAGGSGTVSATSFFPVRDGVISVGSTAPASLHLEILALFDGGADTAGSLRLLPAPVQVVDTAAGIGTDDLTVPRDVHVNGFAAPQGTPHVLARLSASFDEPGTVALSEQEIPFPAGTSTTTTVIATAEDAVAVSAAGADELRIDVIGYVTAADGASPPEAAGESTTAGAVMGLSSAPQRLSLAADAPAEVDLGDLQASAVIGLLSPDVGTAGAITSTYDTNAQHRGTAVTAEAGRAGELVVVDGDSPRLSADIDVEAGFLPVAIVQPDEILDSGEASVTIESFPDHEADADHGVLRFSGTFTASHRIAAIRVEVDGREVSSGAPLSLDGNGGTWHQDIIPSASGPMEVAVTAEDVGGATATATWTGTVTVPADDEVVVSPQARILTDAETGDLTEESEAVLSSQDAPGYAIGDVLVAGASDGLPDGALGQVLAIRYEEGRWLTVLGPATLGNVILQGDFDLVLDSDDADGVVQREADGDERALPTTSAGGAVGGAAGAAPAAPPPRRDGSAGELREIGTDETFSLISRTCDKDLASVPLTSRDEETTSADGLWSLSGSTELEASLTCEADLGLRIAYSADYKPEGAIAVGLDAVQLLKATPFLSDDAAQSLDGVLTTAGSLYESDWTMSTSVIGTAEAALALTGSAKGEVSTVDDELAMRVPLARATFFLGPVPVTLDGDVTLTPKVSLEAEGEFTLSTGFSGEVEHGLTLERGAGTTPLASQGADVTATASGTMSATAGASLTVEPSLTLYKTISLSLSAAPTVEATAAGEFSGSGTAPFPLAEQDAVIERAAEGSVELATSGRRFVALQGRFVVGLDLTRELAAFPRILSVLERADVPLEVTVVDTTFAKTALAEDTLWEYSYPEGLDVDGFAPEIPEPDFSDDGAEMLTELAGKTFVFSSGAGGWGTSYEMGPDGTFTGTYHDSDMGAGVMRQADFEGRFEIGEQIDETTYALELAEFTRTTPASGTEDADGYTIEYQDSVYGFDQCSDFRLLLPATPTSSLNDGQQLWASGYSGGPTLQVFAVTCFEEDRGEDIMHNEMP